MSSSSAAAEERDGSLSPVLEIGAVLAARGHEVHLATNTGQESWAADYPFLAGVHGLGPAIPTAETDEHYNRMRVWKSEPSMRTLLQSKRLFDSNWPSTYRGLRALCEDPATRPAFIIADFFADNAARDMLRQFGIQLASVWPQMPYLMAPASYIPGQPGFQTEVLLTSEHASLAARFRSELVVVRALPALLSWVMWTRRMRADQGVNYPLAPATKPDYLVLVNSFIGLEVPKDLPPLIAAVGPILADQYPPLDDAMSTFLEQHDRTIYISLGTHICLPGAELEKILTGLNAALDAGHINGVIWAIPAKPRANFDLTKEYERPLGKALTAAAIVAGTHPQFLLPSFAPQRAVLAHPSTKLFLTHGGGSSANETLFHGVPVLTIGYFFDQLCNSVRLREAGVGLSLDKSSFTADEIAAGIREILVDEDGGFALNVRRLQRIATIASRRKHLAADLIEEVMCDQELRIQGGVVRRPMHLQTADMRMPLWKARNWDMWFVGFTGMAVTGVAAWWMVKDGWRRLPRIFVRSSSVVRGFARDIWAERFR
ncbi:hypothetical protein G7046_g2313 [Stylonectria norvegica]|nr:hypothetical protein G7046_g2313 [Stylonectria norvegica]